MINQTTPFSTSPLLPPKNPTLTNTMDTTTLGPSPSLSAHSPSFDTHSNLADIAARVISELQLSHPHSHDDDLLFYHNHNHHDEDQSQSSESEFEFSVHPTAEGSSPISADEIFHNGQIKPTLTYPLFDTSLVYPNPSQARIPLRRLLIEERDQTTSSCSSSDVDDLEGVPPESYCVWAPHNKKKDEDEVRMRKKSKSAGWNSKRWRIRDLLHRSSSDGKGTFVFLNSDDDDSKKKDKIINREMKMKMNTKMKKEEYNREDVVGFFANATGISRTLRPF